MSSEKRIWESLPCKNGKTIVVEHGKNLFGNERIKVYRKVDSLPLFIRLEEAEAVYHAMAYFKNEGLIP